MAATNDFSKFVVGLYVLVEIEYLSQMVEAWVDLISV